MLAHARTPGPREKIAGVGASADCHRLCFCYFCRLLAPAHVHIIARAGASTNRGCLHIRRLTVAVHLRRMLLSVSRIAHSCVFVRNADACKALQNCGCRRLLRLQVPAPGRPGIWRVPALLRSAGASACADRCVCLHICRVCRVQVDVHICRHLACRFVFCGCWCPYTVWGVLQHRRVPAHRCKLRLPVPLQIAVPAVLQVTAPLQC